MNRNNNTNIPIDDLIRELQKSIGLVNNNPDGTLAIKHLGLKVKCHISKKSIGEPLSLTFPSYIEAINKDYQANTLSELSLEIGVSPLLLRNKPSIPNVDNTLNNKNKSIDPDILDSENITQNQANNYNLPSNYLVSKNYKTFKI